MSLTDTPNANRLHIALFGRRNSGKSSLINALTGQDTALVSDTPGTTTDLVSKAMEMQGIGPCLFIDTPGFDDEGELGELRISRTLKAIEKTDIALLLCGDTTFFHEKEMLALLKEKNIPVIPVLNKIDIRENNDSLATYIEKECKIRPLLVSAKEEIGIEQIRQAILENCLRISVSKALPESLPQRMILFFSSCRRISKLPKADLSCRKCRQSVNCWTRNV